MKGQKMVPVGKIVRAHGIKGSVKVLPYGESLEYARKGDVIYEGSQFLAYTIRSVQRHKRCWIITFEEIRDRSSAEELVGSELYIPEDSLPETDEDEYYYYQLIGLRVETTQGKFLGILRNIIETGANDVYVVIKDKHEILIPAINDVIKSVDLELGIMIVDPPEGLVDDDY
ncbi:MAG: 16S rRNA processing protein RimM [Deltaproteobacteria bacterium]|nr:16S rRNA processing protein RimM [Deltaproteobacteria bacterium]MBW2068038.1 16S rRNA processing protein RimM [Deltaproteobacteria bacterium]